MTVTVKDFDGAREVIVEEKEGAVFVDDGRFCYMFDRSILIHAIEVELKVLILERDTDYLPVAPM